MDRGGARASPVFPALTRSVPRISWIVTTVRAGSSRSNFPAGKAFLHFFLFFVCAVPTSARAQPDASAAAMDSGGALDGGARPEVDVDSPLARMASTEP